MKWIIPALLALIPVVIGCGGVKAPPPTGKAKDSSTAPTPAIPGATAETPATQPPATEPPPEQPKQATFGKSQARLVDYAEAKKDPKVVEANNRINASDPLTASYESYFSIGSKATMSAFKHNLNLQKELNDGRWPSFEEFSKSAQQMRIEFVPILPWQMIGYDQSNGSLVLLEDKGDKIRRYKAKGIPLDEDDKPYDTE